MKKYIALKTIFFMKLISKNLTSSLKPETTFFLDEALEYTEENLKIVNSLWPTSKFAIVEY